jgi:hypothetical protein
MKKIILLIMLLLFAQAAYADRVVILNLHYKEGKISVIDKVEKYGYYPDRKLQPDTGYRAEIISVEDDVLYSFRFEVPMEHYTDIQIENKTQGGMVLVDETDFAMIVPSLPNAKAINFYDEKDVKVLGVDLTEEESKTNTQLIIGSVILLIIIVYIIAKRKKYESAKVI